MAKKVQIIHSIKVVIRTYVVPIWSQKSAGKLALREGRRGVIDAAVAERSKHSEIDDMYEIARKNMIQ
jgi:hypothetical protein